MSSMNIDDEYCEDSYEKIYCEYMFIIREPHIWFNGVIDHLWAAVVKVVISFSLRA